ncbi:MAG TPA: hypothetical protein ENK38_00055, partial [Gammaproteobacteria bacterium]|nr:hypothetical protein [Gammaproteobacteria bacterium]
MKKKLSPIIAVSLFLAVISLLFPPSSVAGEERIQQELRDPNPTLNPLQKALGKKGYDRAMASGKYRYVGNTKCRLCHREFFVGRKKDPHVYTYERLVAIGYETNKRCLGC